MQTIDCFPKGNGPGTLPRVLSLWLILVTTILMALGTAAAAGELDTDLLAVMHEGETVEAASRHPQSLADAPAHVTVVTKRDIEEFGYETIGEAIASAAGFYTIDDLNYSRLGIRGFAPFGDYGSHVLVMIDGHPMIEPVFASSFFERNQPIDIRCVQRIEIIRGPGSALYGTNAVLSIVNIVTTKATESDPVTVRVSARSNEGGEANVSLGMVSRRGFQARLSGSVTQNEGFDYYFEEFDDPATNFGRARGLDTEQTWGMYAQLKRYGWSLAGLVSSRSKHLPTASWGAPFNDDRLQTKDLMGFIDSKYDGGVGPATHLSARLTYDWYSYKGVWPAVGDDGTRVMEDPHKSKVLGGEIVLASEALARNYVVAGLSMKRVLSATLQAYDTEPEYFESVDIEKTETLISIYAHDEISLHSNTVKGILGARYDHYQSLGDVFNPRFGLIVKSRGGATKFLYGKSFRAPTLYESYYQDIAAGCEPGYVRANPDLKPENAYTYEIVHEADLGRTTHATVSAFYYRLLDQIGETELEGGCITSINSGSSRSKGVEAELHGELPAGVRWSVAHAFTDARNQDTGERLPVSPRNLGNVRLSIPVAGSGASLGLAATYFGSRLTKTGSELKPAVVTNATLYLKRADSHLSIAVTAKNVFGARHLEPAGPEMEQDAVPQGERVVMIRVGWGH